ncbi:Bmp protein [Pseudomonas savastanoi pv. glycinea]|nr:Bmp protein [Pseudomonas savastanoi pv. glycinea]
MPGFRLHARGKCSRRPATARQWRDTDGQDQSRSIRHRSGGCPLALWGRAQCPRPGLRQRRFKLRLGGGRRAWLREFCTGHGHGRIRQSARRFQRYRGAQAQPWPVQQPRRGACLPHAGLPVDICRGCTTSLASGAGHRGLRSARPGQCGRAGIGGGAQGPWVAERRAAVGRFFTTHADDIHQVVRGILQSAASFDAVDTFNARYRLAELTRTAQQLLAGVDVLVVPTAPCMPTIDAVLANPVEFNSQLGYYTNFVNLMNMCAIAIPADRRADGLPAGITLIGPAGADQRLAEIAAAWQPLFGKADQSEAVAMAPLPRNSPVVQVAVVGAHLVGQPLNWQLLEGSARLLGTTTTSADYRLYALAGTSPPKPGLVRVPDQGERIEVEVWEMPLNLFGAFVAAIPAPLGIGSLQLADGQWVKGFICEPVGLEGALDITDFKGWRAYRAAHTSSIAHRSGVARMSNVDRRSFIKLAGIIGLSAALPFGRAYSADAPLVVGFIYVGARDDFGYNQAHAQAAAIIKTLPNVKVIEEENVPETVAVQKTMEAMIR